MVDSYGYPVFLILSEGQRNDITMAIPLLEHAELEGSFVLADKGYDSGALIDYIKDNIKEAVPTITGAAFSHPIFLYS